MRDVSHPVHCVQFLENEIVGSAALAYNHQRALVRIIANIEVPHIKVLGRQSDAKEALILGRHAYGALVSATDNHKTEATELA